MDLNASSIEVPLKIVSLEESHDLMEVYKQKRPSKEHKNDYNFCSEKVKSQIH